MPAPAPPALPATCGDTARSPSILTTWAPRAVRDYNFTAAHRGRKTECEIDANGVRPRPEGPPRLIDLVRLQGATSTEHKACLVTRASTTRRSSITCDGTASPLIQGHHRPHPRRATVLPACRGLDQNAAEDLFVRAKLGRRTFRHRRRTRAAVSAWATT
ncbi:MAG: hypothetical protein ACLU0O_02040 [Collinsella sp.]